MRIIQTTISRLSSPILYEKALGPLDIVKREARPALQLLPTSGLVRPATGKSTKLLKAGRALGKGIYISVIYIYEISSLPSAVFRASGFGGILFSPRSFKTCEPGC